MFLLISYSIVSYCVVLFCILNSFCIVLCFCAWFCIVLIGFAFISLLFQQHELSTVDKTRTISEVHEKIQETITYLKANPKDGRALKSLGALYSEAGLYKEAVSAYISASRELPQDREIQRAFIDLRARGHASSN